MRRRALEDMAGTGWGTRTRQGCEQRVGVTPASSQLQALLRLLMGNLGLLPWADLISLSSPSRAGLTVGP